MNEWVSIISSVGFPIACVIAMGFFIYKVIVPLQHTVENNTKVLGELKTLIERNFDK